MSEKDKPEMETTEQKYNRIMGDGSIKSLIEMVRAGTADWKAGKVYSTDKLKARLRERKRLQ